MDLDLERGMDLDRGMDFDRSMDIVGGMDMDRGQSMGSQPSSHRGTRYGFIDANFNRIL